MRWFLLTVVTLTIGLVLLGCGGGSFNDSSNVMRPLSTGDTFYYQDLLSGQSRMEIYAETSPNIFTNNRYADAFWPYLQYDAVSGRITVYRQGSYLDSTQKQYSFPIVMTPGAPVTIYNSDGTTGTALLSGFTAVTVPAGKFWCYSFVSNGYQLWISPALGMMVKIREVNGDDGLDLTTYSISD